MTASLKPIPKCDFNKVALQSTCLYQFLLEIHKAVNIHTKILLFVSTSVMKFVVDCLTN